MMITRVAANKLLIAVVVILAVVEARLQGGGTHGSANTRSATRVSGSKNKKKLTQLRARKMTEKEENEILLKMEKEYHLEQASKQKAHENAMKAHNKIGSDEEVLQEMQELDASLHEEEKQHQQRAKEEIEKEETKKNEQKSLIDMELEKSILKQKEEYQKYDDMLKLKKKDAVRDKKIFNQAKKAAREHKELQDDMAKHMHEHMHGNDEQAAKDDEKYILDMKLEEQKYQEEALQKKMEYEQKLADQYKQQQELIQKTMDLLMDSN